MPINPIVLQRRHAELGRIRLGQKVATQSGKSRPDKLDRFRFTSPNERHIRDLASVYGGDARPWANGTKSEWEVITSAKSIPVIVVKGGISQWMETWSGGGCVHRCDGVTDALTDSPCNPDDPNHQNAKATTRLSVMLPELGAIGVWRLESHGWNAAAELPGLVELAMHVGDLVPANLVLHERTAIKDGKTSKFVVPGLDLEITPRQLAAIVSGEQTQTGPTAVTSSPRATAIGSGPAPIDQVDWQAMLEAATTPLECRAIWTQAGEAGQLTDGLQQAIRARAEAVAASAAAAPAPDQGDDQAALDDLWFLAVAEAGRHGMTDADLRGAFVKAHGHGVDAAQVSELEAFLAELKKDVA